MNKSLLKKGRIFILVLGASVGGALAARAYRSVPNTTAAPSAAVAPESAAAGGDEGEAKTCDFNKVEPGTEKVARVLPVILQNFSMTDAEKAKVTKIMEAQQDDMNKLPKAIVNDTEESKQAIEVRRAGSMEVDKRTRAALKEVLGPERAGDFYTRYMRGDPKMRFRPAPSGSGMNGMPPMPPNVPPPHPAPSH